MRILVLLLCFVTALVTSEDVALAQAVKHWIESVSDDGTIIKLEDGSIWEVDEIDRITSELWLSTDDVVIVDDEKMINTDDDETVQVSLVKSADLTRSTHYLPRPAPQFPQSLPRHTSQILKLEEVEGAEVYTFDNKFIGMAKNVADPRSIISQRLQNRAVSEILATAESTAPCKLFVSGKFLGYISTNKAMKPRLGPYSLLGYLRYGSKAKE